jgi:cobalt-zinc-cadmium efflux system protein
VRGILRQPLSSGPMAGGHDHARLLPRPAAAAAGSVAERRHENRRRMAIALAINAGMLVAAALGGVLTGSLALLADAGHVLSDLGAIVLALLAAALAARSGGPRRTFGYQRTEVIAALANGVALVVIAVLVVVAALNRLADPPGVEGAGVLALGVVGLLGNAAATWTLARGRRDDINLEAVLRHSVADALGSLAVVVSGAVILATGWRPIDPLASIAIAALILGSSIRLVREPLDVLMEAAPPGVDVNAIARAVASVPGVTQVHELHLWSLTPGFEALAAHVVVARGEDRDRARREVEFVLRDRYGIEHTTLQMEEEADRDALLQLETRARRR